MHEDMEKLEALQVALQQEKKITAELREHLEQANATWSGKWELDMLTKAVSWSPQFYQMLGIDEREPPDLKKFTNKLTGTCREKLNGAISRVLVTRQAYTFEHFLLVADKTLNVKTELRPLFNEAKQPVKLVGKLIDITEQKSQQKELEKLSLIAANTSNGVLMLGKETKIDWVNNSYTIMTGFRLEEVKGKLFTFMLIDQDETAYTQRDLEATFQHQSSIKQEIQIGTKSDKKLWVVINITPILDFELNPEGYIVIITDITDRKKAEEQLSIRNKEITDSIRYAKRFQDAMLPPPELFERLLPQSFVTYLPKDIVSGDFYWLKEKGDKIYAAVVDCTGHGVPGAFVSIIGYKELNRALFEFDHDQPATILNKLSELVIQSFNTDKETNIRDGMDIALCMIDLPNMRLEYAGANNAAYIVRRLSAPTASNGSTSDHITDASGQYELIELKADKQPIGDFQYHKSFSTKTIDLQPGDTLYLFSDGFADQFGGPKGKKFMSKRFKELLLEMQDQSMPDQQYHLELTFEQWKGAHYQLDDVCVMGIRV